MFGRIERGVVMAKDDRNNLAAVAAVSNLRIAGSREACGALKQQCAAPGPCLRETQGRLDLSGKIRRPMQ